MRLAQSQPGGLLGVPQLRAKQECRGNVRNASIVLKNFRLRQRLASGSLPSAQGGRRAMMGERTVMQEALFYGFSLERHVQL